MSTQPPKADGVRVAALIPRKDACAGSSPAIGSNILDVLAVGKALIDASEEVSLVDIIERGWGLSLGVGTAHRTSERSPRGQRPAGAE